MIAIGSGPVVAEPATGEVSSAQLNNMDQGQPRLGTDFSHFVSISVGDDEEQTKGLEKLQNRLEEIEGIGRKKNLKKLHITLMTLNVTAEEREMVEASFIRAGEKFT